MKKSRHFLETTLPKRPYLTDDVLLYVIENAETIEAQLGNKVAYWSFVHTLNKYVKIVLSNNKETVITGYIDRDYERRRLK